MQRREGDDGKREMALIIRPANASKISQKKAFLLDGGVNNDGKNWVWARREMGGRSNT